jgi:hypothetical protein
MPDTGLKRSPKFQKGALVQLVKDLVGIVPNVIPFQYNLEKLSHSLTPWNPFEIDQTQRGAQAPTVQPFDPEESFNLTLEIDATDDLEDSDPVAIASGIADRLAALKKLTLPTQGLIGDLVVSARALAGKTSEHAVRPTVPVVLFVWGPSCSWLFGKPGLHEVMIEGIRRTDPKSLHHNKRDAVGERVVFVLVLQEVIPTVMKQAFIYMNHLDRGAAEEIIPNLNGLGMIAATIEERDDFIKHIGGRHQARQGLGDLFPVPLSRRMILIVGKLKRE